MATHFVQPPYADVTIGAADDWKLVHPKSGSIRRWVIQFNNDNTFSGSVTIKGHICGSALSPVAIPYKKFYLNGAVADESDDTAAITTTSIIEVIADEMDVVFSCTSFTSGSGTLTVRPLQG